MEDCFSDIHAFHAGYERAKDYLGADFDGLKAPKISEVNSTKEPKLCFKCHGMHFQKRFMKNKGHSNCPLAFLQTSIVSVFLHINCE